MKLVRYGSSGREKPGLIDGEGRLRDLSVAIEDIGPATLSPQGLNSLRSIAPESLPRVKGRPRLGPPVAGISKIVGVGLNYRDHAKEAGLAVPQEPILFMKATTCLGGPDDPILLPPGSAKTDWEVELALVIGTTARRVPVARALEHVAGYCVANDVSEREWQLERGSQWDKGKGCDSFGPLGPWLVTADEVADPQALRLWLELNGERMQDGSTADMVFGCAELVSVTSAYMTLLPGDVILSGTPAGVGLGRRPQRFLRPGDRLRLGIDGLGVQEQQVTAG
ncbi:MAG TPA: fumarylacetoacetate hydrolase family protein [Candidatus Desulfobacillus sp.]|nr:fumarylacetoacetate hydrolase family protein [Candidatus Desulfobacillus sp.]